MSNNVTPIRASNQPKQASADTPRWVKFRQKFIELRRVATLMLEEREARGSLYRLWWRCLSESEHYAAALRGERGEPYASMARDFGQLGRHFTFWWLFTGRILFAEQVFKAPVSELDMLRDGSDEDEMVAWRDLARPSIYLRIPLTLERREILRQVDELVSRQQEAHADSIEATRKPRRGFYPDQRIRRDTIETLLEVWKARKGTDEAWWQTGQRLGHWPQFTPTPKDNDDEVKRKRRLMTLTLQRLHKMAANLIDYAARGDFPRVK